MTANNFPLRHMSAVVAITIQELNMASFMQFLCSVLFFSAAQQLFFIVGVMEG